MSTPPPETQPPDLDQVIRELRGDMVESRNLTIKTDNLIKNLSADVRQIGKRQEMFEKRLMFNSIGAYVLFSVIIFTTLFLAFQAQVAREHAMVAAARDRVTELEQRTVQVEAELDRRQKAEEEAYTLFRLMEEGKKDEALARYPVVRGRLINRGEKELMADAVDRLNRELAETAFNYGRDAFQRNDFTRARDAFLKSLSHVEKAPYGPKLHVYLGLSLFNLKDYAAATDHLRKALAHKHDRSTSSKATFHLARALELLGRHGEARRAYGYYLKHYAAYDRDETEAAVKRIREYMKRGVEASGPRIGDQD